MWHGAMSSWHAGDGGRLVPNRADMVKAKEAAMLRITIETELGCQCALERIAELAGCLERTEELRALAEAVKVWDTQRWARTIEQPSD